MTAKGRALDALDAYDRWFWSPLVGAVDAVTGVRWLRERRAARRAVEYASLANSLRSAGLDGAAEQIVGLQRRHEREAEGRNR